MGIESEVRHYGEVRIEGDGTWRRMMAQKKGRGRGKVRSRLRGRCELMKVRLMVEKKNAAMDAGDGGSGDEMEAMWMVVRWTMVMVPTWMVMM